MPGLYADKPIATIREVMKNGNQVALRCVDPRLIQDIRSMFACFHLFCFPTGDFTASHPNNCGNAP